MEKKYRDIIAKEFRDCVLNTIKRLDNAETNRPFHAALLSDEALFWSRFERSFSTSFGQRVIEEISKIAAIAGGASDASRQRETIVRLDKAVDTAITAHIQALREASKQKWGESISKISRTYLTGEFVELRIISDLW